MNQPVISIENLGKRYRLGTMGAASLKADAGAWLRKRLGKENAEEEGVHFWALKDINLQIHQGEAVGFVGNNGAGKSTLLKIIARIVQPTVGAVQGRGKLASLLELGTGFEPMLTGRENIYLNGNILGMTNADIKRQFDAIVDFSGIEKFLDTPVKRYSSGMYVRLGFAIAAHLNTDILIVDEVLAVGDADFQKKCLGKMKEVSTQAGKTVLFVSHDAQAVLRLCSHAVWLDKGQLMAQGLAPSVVQQYLARNARQTLHRRFAHGEAPGNDQISILQVSASAEGEEPDLFSIAKSITLECQFWHLQSDALLTVGIYLYTSSWSCIFRVDGQVFQAGHGLFKARLTIPAHFLNAGSYSVSWFFGKDGTTPLFHFNESLSFEVADQRENGLWPGPWDGAVRPSFPIEISAMDQNIAYAS